MKLFYYAAINVFHFWLAQGSNGVKAVRSFSVKYPIAVGAFQFDYVFCHKKHPQSQYNHFRTYTPMFSHIIAYQRTLKRDPQK
jgi:hypothetical protein